MRRFISILFLCLCVGLTPKRMVAETVLPSGWFLFSNCVAFGAHAFCEDNRNAAAISLGIVGAFYAWEEFFHSKTREHCHFKNILAILLGSVEGGVCGCSARNLGLVKTIKNLYPADSESKPAENNEYSDVEKTQAENEYETLEKGLQA